MINEYSHLLVIFEFLAEYHLLVLICCLSLFCWRVMVHDAISFKLSVILSDNISTPLPKICICIYTNFSILSSVFFTPTMEQFKRPHFLCFFWVFSFTWNKKGPKPAQHVPDSNIKVRAVQDCHRRSISSFEMIHQITVDVA